ncbi:MAG: LysE family transporter, partial [Cryobacterium sp.]
MTLVDTLLPLLLGLGTGLALIIAIGAQNAFILRLGIAGDTRTIGAAVAVCAVSDAVLIFAGIVGIGVLVDQAPVALSVVHIVGAAFLLGYGVFALVRVWRPRALLPDGSTVRVSTRAAVLTTVGLTWLNPHVYLDTLIFLGSVA